MQTAAEEPTASKVETLPSYIEEIGTYSPLNAVYSMRHYDEERHLVSGVHDKHSDGLFSWTRKKNSVNLILTSLCAIVDFVFLKTPSIINLWFVDALGNLFYVKLDHFFRVMMKVEITRVQQTDFNERVRRYFGEDARDLFFKQGLQAGADMKRNREALKKNASYNYLLKNLRAPLWKELNELKGSLKFKGRTAYCLSGSDELGLVICNSVEIRKFCRIPHISTVRNVIDYHLCDRKLHLNIMEMKDQENLRDWDSGEVSLQLVVFDVRRRKEANRSYIMTPPKLQQLKETHGAFLLPASTCFVKSTYLAAGHTSLMVLIVSLGMLLQLQVYSPGTRLLVPLFTFMPHHKCEITCIAFSQESFITAGRDGRIGFWRFQPEEMQQKVAALSL